VKEKRRRTNERDASDQLQCAAWYTAAEDSEALSEHGSRPGGREAEAPGGVFFFGSGGGVGGTRAGPGFLSKGGAYEGGRVYVVHSSAA
jgi:hypothetical protein